MGHHNEIYIKGVDPNAVVVGGIAVGVTSAVGAAIASKLLICTIYLFTINI